MQFWAYVQAGDDALDTNTMELRTRGCIALGTSGNGMCGISKNWKRDKNESKR